MVIVNLLGQVCTLGRAPRTKETLLDFCKWCWVTRHPRVFRKLTGCQRTPWFWGVTSQLKQLLISTANRSILVVEDIDCSLELQDRRAQQPRMMNLDLARMMNIDPYPTTQVHFFFSVFNRSII